MGFFSSVGNAIGRGLNFVGGIARKAGEIGSGIAKRVGEFAPQIGSAVGGLLGNNPVGDFVKGIGQKVGSFATGAGQAIAQGVRDIGGTISSMGNSLTNSGMKSG